MAKQKNILLVEPNHVCSRFYSDRLQRFGKNLIVLSAKDREDAFRVFAETKIDLAIIKANDEGDLQIDNVFPLIRAITERNLQIKIMVIMDPAVEDYASQLLIAGVAKCVTVRDINTPNKIVAQVDAILKIKSAIQLRGIYCLQIRRDERFDTWENVDGDGFVSLHQVSEFVMSEICTNETCLRYQVVHAETGEKITSEEFRKLYNLEKFNLD